MKYILPIIIVFSTTLSHGQIELDKYDEIVLVDYQNWNFNRFYGRTYLINLNERQLKLYDLKILTGTELFEQTWAKLKTKSTDSLDKSQYEINNYLEEIKRLKAGYNPVPEIVRELDSAEINNLFNEIVPDFRHDQILNKLGLTIDSLNNQLDTYLIKYLTDYRIKYKKEKLTYCKNKLNNIELFKKSSIILTNSQATSDYPRVSVELRNAKDTLTFYTEGQHPFMLPWYDNKGKIYSYNPNFSKVLGQLLPRYEHSNKDRLVGKDGLFGDYLESLFFLTIKTNCINDKGKLITH